MAAFSFAKTLFVASLLVLVISSDATRPIEKAAAAASTESGVPCMKHKLMTTNKCHDICNQVGFNSYHFVPFTDMDPQSVCCCCKQGSKCTAPSVWP